MLVLKTACELGVLTALLTTADMEECVSAALLHEVQRYHRESLQGNGQGALLPFPFAQERLNSPQSLRSDFSE